MREVARRLTSGWRTISPGGRWARPSPSPPARAGQLGLSAVLEEKDGTKSYWALAHPRGDKPDFHAPDCFAAQPALDSRA